MSDRFEFWIHGVNVHVEDTNPALQLEIRRSHLGTTICQNGDTSNRFHIAIPTPTWLDDDEVEHYDAYLQGEVNAGARITKVQIWQAGIHLPHFETPPHYEISGSLTGPNSFREYYNLPDVQVWAPIVMSIHVDFAQRTIGETLVRGCVTFVGAGVRFEERY